MKAEAGPAEKLLNELYQLTYEDITPKKWHAMEAEILEHQVLRRGYSEIYEKEYIREDGNVFPVEVRTYRMDEENGQIAGMWAVVREITERKWAE
jgi:PAS domain S-box-containing protein